MPQTQTTLRRGVIIDGPHKHLNEMCINTVDGRRRRALKISYYIIHDANARADDDDDVRALERHDRHTHSVCCSNTPVLSNGASLGGWLIDDGVFGL